MFGEHSIHFQHTEHSPLSTRFSSASNNTPSAMQSARSSSSPPWLGNLSTHTPRDNTLHIGVRTMAKDDLTPEAAKLALCRAAPLMGHRQTTLSERHSVMYPHLLQSHCPVVGALSAMSHEFGQKCVVLGLLPFLMLSVVLVGVGAFESGPSKMSTYGST
jgi:hypothetical protein